MNRYYPLLMESQYEATARVWIVWDRDRNQPFSNTDLTIGTYEWYDDAERVCKTLNDIEARSIRRRMM